MLIDRSRRDRSNWRRRIFLIGGGRCRAALTLPIEDAGSDHQDDQENFHRQLKSSRRAIDAEARRLDNQTGRVTPYDARLQAARAIRCAIGPNPHVGRHPKLRNV